MIGDSVIDHETAIRAETRCCLTAYGFGYITFPGRIAYRGRVDRERRQAICARDRSTCSGQGGGSRAESRLTSRRPTAAAALTEPPAPAASTRRASRW